MEAAGDAASPSAGIFLILEANPLTQAVLKSVVAPLGLLTETAASMDTAVGRLAAGGVTGLLVDAALLGAETADRVASVSRLATAGAARIVVTWPSPDEDTVRALIAAGATEVIAKPISAGRLTAALKAEFATET